MAPVRRARQVARTVAASRRRSPYPLGDLLPRRRYAPPGPPDADKALGMSGLLRRRLHLPRHRGTTAHLGSAYPFQAGSGLGPTGVFLGTDILAGGAGFAYDPFELYGDGTLTNPNMLFAGEPGVGKSAAAKTFIYRSVGVFGRWVAIADPKGEYL